jgi:hypothetical protein
MRHQKVIIHVAGLVLLVTVIVWLYIARHASAPEVEVLAYAQARGGHLGSLYSDCFTVALVTNRTSFQLLFYGPVVEKQLSDGTIVSDLGAALWNGKSHDIFVPAGAAVSLPVDIGKGTSRLRVNFHYLRSAGSLRAAVSHAMFKIHAVRNGPPKSLERLRFWAFQHGLIDGSYHLTCAGPWVSSEELRCGNTSVIAAQTNRTSSGSDSRP